jgi:predicted GNAT family acetyltransferase
MKMAYFNSVVRSQITSENVEEKVVAVLNDFRLRDENTIWWITSSSTPTNLNEIIEKHGCQFLWRDTGMALDLSVLPEISPIPELTIAPISTEEDIQAWLKIYGTGFDLSDSVRDDYGKALRTILQHHTHIGPYYLARHQGEPVTIASLYLNAGVTGVYEVATSPEKRKQGFGRALVLKALHDAHQNGYQIAVLQSSKIGLSLYQRLGFQTFNFFDAYAISTRESPE